MFVYTFHTVPINYLISICSALSLSNDLFLHPPSSFPLPPRLLLLTLSPTVVCIALYNLLSVFTCPLCLIACAVVRHVTRRRCTGDECHQDHRCSMPTHSLWTATSKGWVCLSPVTVSRQVSTMLSYLSWFYIFVWIKQMFGNSPDLLTNFYRWT